MKNKFKFPLSLKFSIVLFVLLGIAVALNGHSYRVSIHVIESDIQKSYYEQLQFLLFQLDSQVDNLAASLLELEEDTTTKQYINTTAPEDLYDLNTLRFNMHERVKLHSASSNWQMEISVFLESRNEVISTNPDIVYEDLAAYELNDTSSGIWSYYPSKNNNANYFSLLHSSLDYSILARIPDTYIRDMLKNFQQKSNRHTLMYHSLYGFIGIPPEELEGWEQHINWQKMQQTGKEILTINGKRVLLNYAPVESLNWVMIDMVLLDQVVLPIKESNQFFVLGIVAMLAIGVVISVLIYRQIQYPINELVQKLKDIRSGNYSSRLETKQRDEFQEVFSGFNNMAERIQELIEKVYEEKLRLKEAELKQLQAQINPHFLYNCLFYIKNMAKMGEDEQVVAMALNLGEYYRYTTRLENPLATVREEVKFLQNYLNILSFRRPIQYEIDIPDRLMEMSIPRLFIQPLVENAIHHGIRNSEQEGQIRIEGSMIEGGFIISVEDSGDCLDDSTIEQLYENVNRPLTPDIGFGLWNTCQRVTNLFLPGSGLEFERSSLGGLKVSIRCIIESQEDTNAKLANSG